MDINSISGATQATSTKKTTNTNDNKKNVYDKYDKNGKHIKSIGINKENGKIIGKFICTNNSGGSVKEHTNYLYKDGKFTKKETFSNNNGTTDENGFETASYEMKNSSNGYTSIDEDMEGIFKHINSMG